jgi:hypothetical protein
MTGDVGDDVLDGPHLALSKTAISIPEDGLFGHYFAHLG